MELYDFLRNRVQDQDGFIKNLHLNFVHLAEGEAIAEIAVDKELLNPMGTVHGGCLFSICDTVGGTAAMTHGVMVTTTMATISYVRPGGGNKLIAKASEIKAGNALFRYDVCIYDEKDELICKAMLEYFKTADIKF